MKNSTLILVIISMSLLSCGTKNGATLTDNEKEVIKSEITPLMKQIAQNSESGNLDKAIEPYSNKPEFLSITNGQLSDYNKFVEGNKQYFEALESQIFNQTLMNFTFINKDNVIVTWGGSALAKRKIDNKSKLLRLQHLWYSIKVMEFGKSYITMNLQYLLQ